MPGSPSSEVPAFDDPFAILEACPEQHSDEERDLFPAVRAVAEAMRDVTAIEAMAALGTLERQHRDRETAWVALRDELDGLVGAAATIACKAFSKDAVGRGPAPGGRRALCERPLPPIPPLLLSDRPLRSPRMTAPLEPPAPPVPPPVAPAVSAVSAAPAASGPRSGRALGLAAVLAAAVAWGVGGVRLDSRFLFHPQPHPESTWRAVAARHGAEPIELLAADGARLRGWLLPAAGVAQEAAPAAGPALIYLGGNAEEVSWMLAEAHRVPGRMLLAINYRGYGASAGAPHERSLYADALAAFDWLATRPGVDAARIAVWGRSLGSGVATWVAAHRPVEAVVLTSPFDSIAALAALHQPLLAPLLTQPFDSLSRARTIDAPMLALVGGRDTLVPPAHSERLVAGWRGPARIELLPVGGHGDLQADPAYWRAVARFLDAPGRP